MSERIEKTGDQIIVEIYGRNASTFIRTSRAILREALKKAKYSDDEIEKVFKSEVFIVENDSDTAKFILELV